MGFASSRILNSKRQQWHRRIIGKNILIQFTHEGHMGEVTDLDWNPYNMMLGSTEEIGNTLQFYEIVIIYVI